MSEMNYQRWVCDACGFIYDEAKGDPDSGLAPGTRFADIPDDWECPLCGLTKTDLRLLPAAVPIATTRRQTNKPNAISKGGKDYIVIVGAGIAGWSAAEAIRRRDTETPILLVSACKGSVYPKPAISMALSQGKKAADLIDMDADSKAAELGIEVRTESRIIRLDTGRKRLTTVKGAIEYNKLILALGAHQRELPITGTATDSILRVNDLNSYQKMYDRLQMGIKHITILGAGLIGCEFADDLSKAGYSVTIVDPQKQALSGLLPDSMGSKLKQKLLNKGVDWHFGHTLNTLDKQEEHLLATLSDDTQLKTDLVISAAGLIANTKLAEKAKLEVDNGIIVNNDMQTSDADIYAIGDCASVDGQVFAYIEPIRRQAEAIAANIIGENESFMPLPPLIKVKTPSLPMSICRPTNEQETKWTPILSEGDNEYFELRQGELLLGFALSGKKASEAGGVYQQLLGNT